MSFARITVALCLLGALLGPAARASAPPHAGDLWFAGHWWSVTDSGKDRFLPGPNYFSASKRNVWVDGKGRLHLKITKVRGRWLCPDIQSEDTFGYGAFTWRVGSGLLFDPNIVLGLFTWNDQSEFNHREIDFESARWGDRATSPNADFTVQGFDTFDNEARISAQRPGTVTINWLPYQIGFSYNDQSWTYRGVSDPPPSASIDMNLWLFNGAAPTNGRGVEVIISSLSFTPWTV
ncbi:MAG: LamG domain-containing protein [Actinomycetota bacterium]